MLEDQQTEVTYACTTSKRWRHSRLPLLAVMGLPLPLCTHAILSEPDRALLLGSDRDVMCAQHWKRLFARCRYVEPSKLNERSTPSVSQG